MLKISLGNSSKAGSILWRSSRLVIHIQYLCWYRFLCGVCAVVPGILVCSSFLISVCMFYCVESFAHIECYSDLVEVLTVAL